MSSLGGIGRHGGLKIHSDKGAGSSPAANIKKKNYFLSPYRIRKRIFFYDITYLYGNQYYNKDDNRGNSLRVWYWSVSPCGAGSNPVSLGNQ